ncbi:MAG: glycosyltransferase family 4 protein [Bacteroidota bacterium]|nr:glycosyltransferase family 4 protein [Bacteroidota bacterium]
MPKVLRIINRLNLGGPTLNAAYLSKFMEPGFETLLVSGMKDDSEESSEFIVKDLDLHPVYVPEMYRELHPFRDYKSYYKLRKIIDEFKPDIVHTHAAKAGAVGRLAASHSGVPVIVHTFHGHIFHSYFNPVKTRMFLEIERFLARRTSKIVVLSEIQKQELGGIYKIAPDKKFEIIPLGFDLRKFNDGQVEKRKDFREKYNLDDDEIAIGIVGRLVPIKNHELFLKALSIVSKKTTKKIRAFIVGDGEDRKKIEQLATSLGIEFTEQSGEKKLLTFTSWIKHIDIAFAGLDIIALTSNNEGTPVSLIEAQAAGKPIVSTNVGGIENIVIKDETALLSKVGDENAFAANLLQLTESEEMRKKISGQGNSFVHSRFSYQRLCGDMSQLYYSLLDKV